MATTPDALVVPGYEIRRWRRFGHDRLYVAVAGAAEGEQLGYRDLATGTDHPVQRHDHSLLAGIADAWARQADAASAPTVAADPVESRAPETPARVERPWVDLSRNEPGRSAQGQASVPIEGQQISCLPPQIPHALLVGPEIGPPAGPAGASSGTVPRAGRRRSRGIARRRAFGEIGRRMGLSGVSYRARYAMPDGNRYSRNYGDKGPPRSAASARRPAAPPLSSRIGTWPSADCASTPCGATSVQHLERSLPPSGSQRARSK